MVSSSGPVLTDGVQTQPPAPPAWNEQTFRAWVEDVFHDEPLVVLANRAPAEHVTAKAGGGGRGGSSGLVTALEPLISNCRLLWVARGDNATPLDSMVHESAEPHVSPANSRLRLRRVSISPQVEQGYYDGFCNEGLWPLCHRTPVRPIFRELDFQMYVCATAQWVAALCEQVTSHSPIVLVQDYHLALAPKMIREQLPSATVVTFWHVPFPSPRTWSGCPQERELIAGLLGSAIVGVQTAEDRENFLDTAVCVLGAHVDRDEHIVSYGNRRTRVRVYPASVEWPSRWSVGSSSIGVSRTIVNRRFGLAPDARLIVGVDRLDYTKGFVQKFLAVERLLVTRPELRGKVVLLQVAEPSRSGLPAYREYRKHAYEVSERVNQRFRTRGYEPIVLVEGRMSHEDVFLLLRSADVCYVGSLHDGMNLVSKEFVSARHDERGVLVLSEFAGAACELTEALSINPYLTEDCARTLAEALNMPVDEQARRMRALRAVVNRNNSYKWASDILADAAAERNRRRQGLRPRRRVAPATITASA
jgi:trehalose 6-phosphate synthase